MSSISKTKKTYVANLEEDTFASDDNNESPPSDIIAFNELRSCADLFRMHNEGSLKIQPEFQREVVWPSVDQTRFIDSLIKSLPIPSMCFSFDYKTEQWQVIDGLQRMASIIRFLGGDPTWKLADIKDVDTDLRGAMAADFAQRDSKLHKFFKRVQNISIPVTVLRCDLSKKSHSEYLFTIFHRLNSGGMKLNSQEIRNCIYSGTLNDLLHELNEHPTWKKLNKMKHVKGYRFKKQEIILRIFAYEERLQKYDGRLSTFLNEYMRDHRNLTQSEVSNLRDHFNEVLAFTWVNVLGGKLPSRLNVTILEGLLVGVGKNLSKLKKENTSTLRAKYKKFQALPAYSEVGLSEGLSKTHKVIERIQGSVDVFKE